MRFGSLISTSQLERFSWLYCAIIDKDTSATQKRQKQQARSSNLGLHYNKSLPFIVCNMPDSVADGFLYLKSMSRINAP